MSFYTTTIYGALGLGKGWAIRMRIELFGWRVEWKRLKEIRAWREAKKRPAAESHPVTTAWWMAFESGGALVVQCLCGRTNFAGGSEVDYEEGELELLREKARLRPDAYIEDPESDSIGVAEVGHGQVIAWGCPCGCAEKFEDLLEGSREQIAKYYELKLQAAETAVKLIERAREKSAAAAHGTKLALGLTAER
jgi:hypothetical protein